MAPFDIKELCELMRHDDLELDTQGGSKAALFFCISDMDDVFNFVVAYSQQS